MRVGLFLRNLDEEFQITVFRGIRTQARLRGIDLVCIQGETIRPDASQKPFALAGEVAFDGFLILSSVIVDNNQSLHAKAIPSLLPAVPAVSVGLKIPGMVSLTFQTKRSLRRIVEHLILDHGYRRLLYLGGPPEHEDNQIRQQVFLSVLEKYSAHWPELQGTVEHGGFSEAGGIRAIRPYLDGQPFDAVVAANDNMALGVLKLLRLHGNPAWQACAVTGFDDIPQASLEDTPLTSVHLPLERLGAMALDTLADQLAGKPVPLHRTVPSTPVIRQSCGCPAPPTRRAAEQLRWEGRGTVRSAFESEQRMRQGNFFGRDLSAVVDRPALWLRLEEFLSVSGIRDFFLLTTEKDGSYLVYERRDGLRTNLPENGLPLTAEALFTDRPIRRGTWDLCVSDLNPGGDVLGLAVYAADHQTLPHIGAGIPHIAHALKRLKTQAEQEDRNRQLEAVVRARTIQLTEANQALREEVALRTAKELEVLQVSEFERRRFGLDLHDDICQRLAGLTMYLKGFAKQPPANASDAWTEVGDMVEETLQRTRQYSHASFPIDLERRGLGEVLRILCETVALQHSRPCLYGSGPGVDRFPLSETQALHVYRIVQEALQNAVRHSQASNLEVTLEAGDGALVLRVADNGTGLAADAAPSGGLGFRSMAYRASQLGAHFDVSSRPGVGTVVRLEIPRGMVH